MHVGVTVAATWLRTAAFSGLLGLASLFAAGGQEKAAEALWKVPVTVEGGGSAPARLSAVDLSSGERLVSDGWQVETPWEGVIELPPSSGWQLAAQAEGFWAASRAVVADGQPARLRLLPTGTAAGGLRWPRGEPAPPEVAVRFAGAPGPEGQSDPDLPETTVTCSVAEGRWACRLPAGVLDLRIEAPDYTPHYFWDVAVQPGRSVDLGGVRLARGASVAGWVETPGQSPEGGTTVELEPRGGGWLGDPTSRRRMSSLARETRANERGFFQLGAVAPGGYLLRARQSGLPPVEVYPVDVAAGEELVLADAVVLRPAADLHVVLDPPVDPRGSPWIVGIQRLEAMTHISNAPDEAAADLGGTWSHPGLAAGGGYTLRVTDTEGSAWVWENLELEPGRNDVPVDIPLVRIAGRIRRGGEPVRGTLIFGSTQGRQQIRVTADEDGELEGYLPHEGVWPVELALTTGGIETGAQALDPVEVRVAPGQPVARLALELPDTCLAIQVFEEDRPVEADLTMVRTGEDKRREVVARTSEDGELELLGLSPGTVVVRASTRYGKASEWIAVEIREKAAIPRLELVIEEKTTLAGEVRFRGTPFPGARIVAYPDYGGPAAMTTREISRFDGVFELRLPARATSTEIIVIPPGFDVQIFKIPLSRSPAPLTIDLESSGSTLTLLRSAGASRKELWKTAELVHRGADLKVRLLASLLRVSGRWEHREDRVSFQGLEPGEYRLCPPASECRSVVLNPGSEAFLDFRADSRQAEAVEGAEP